MRKSRLQLATHTPAPDEFAILLLG
jgi:hypothetical protein